MTAPSVLAFLDSTELSMDSRLSAPRWDSLRRAIVDQQLSLAVSEVTVGEVTRQVAERVAKFNEVDRDHRRQLGAHLHNLSAHEPISAPTFETELRSRLAESGVHVQNLPRVSHATLVSRDFAGLRPFKRNGTGYRDALIWMTFVEWVTGLKYEPSAVFFVSANRSDFADASGDLHTDLRGDLPPGITVTLAERLQPVVEAARPPADWFGVDAPVAVASAEAAALREFDSYLRFPIEDLPVEEPYVDMPPFDRGIITSLAMDPLSVEASLIDKVDGVQIWEVAASAGITIEARVWSWADARDLPEGWRLSNTPADSVPPYVVGTFESTWVADVRISHSGDAKDAAVSRVTLRLPQRS